MSTRLHVTAKRRARIVVAKLEEHLSFKESISMTMTDQQLQELIHLAISDAKAITLESHIARSKPLNSDARRSQLETVEYFIGDYREALALSDYRIAHSQVSSIIKQVDVELDPQSTKFKELCREYIGGIVEMLEGEKDLLNGVASNPYSKPLSSSKTPSEAPSELPECPPAQDLIEDFLRDRKDSQGIKENTATEYRNAITDLAFILADTPANKVKYEQVTTLIETMKQLPRHRNKKAAYKERTVEELLKMDIPDADLTSLSNVNQKPTRFTTYFSWLEQRELISRNPFIGRSIKSEPEKRVTFSIEDLNIIFKSALYSDSPYAKRKTTSASYWWLPLLALYTGARISELVQMRTSDIDEVKGILYAKVRGDESYDQRLKTQAAWRDFPIHPTLLHLGFREYLSELRASGIDRVLPDFCLKGRTPGQKAGKWWGEIYRKTHLPEHLRTRSTPFHSFRHTYITEAKNEARITIEYIQQMVGHDRSQMGATKGYDHGMSIPALFKEIEKIQFDGLELSHLIDGWKKHPLGK